MEGYISVTQASEKSGLSGAQIRKLLAEGKLEGIKIGSYWAVDSYSLDQYIESARKPGPKKGFKV